MDPTLSHELAKARIADLHRQAQRDTLARAARKARRARTHRPGHPPTGYPAVIRRLLTALGTRASA